MSELDDFVTETSDAEPTVETIEEPVVETVETPEAPTAPTEKTQETHEPQMVPLAAKQAEKDKRQAAETRAQAAENRAKDLEQQLLQRDRPAIQQPDFYDDPQAAINTAVITSKVEISDALGREKYDDYDDTMNHWNEMVKTNPSLFNQVISKPLPTIEAYKLAKNDLSVKEMGDVKSFREKIRLEERAKLEAEYKKPSVDVPLDLTAVRSSGGDPVKRIPDGDAGLAALLKR